MSLGVACRLLQPLSTRGHTRRAFDPRTRVGLSPRYSPAPTDAGCVGFHGALPHREPASHSPFAPAFARRAPLAWTGQTVGRGARAKADARSWTIRACPPRSASSTWVAGSTRREVWSPSRLIAPAEVPLGCRPAKGETVEKTEVLFAALEPLRDRRIAPPCAPGSEHRHATSEEALLGSSRAFFTASAVPSTDEESTRTGATVQTMGAEAPGWFGRSLRPPRHLRPNQLAGRCAANFMGPFSYESGFHAIQKAPEQCFFSCTSSPQGCPQLLHPYRPFPGYFPRFVASCSVGRGVRRRNVHCLSCLLARDP
jgi:hypothetical protein